MQIERTYGRVSKEITRVRSVRHALTHSRLFMHSDCKMFSFTRADERYEKRMNGFDREY